MARSDISVRVVLHHELELRLLDVARAARAYVRAVDAPRPAREHERRVSEALADLRGALRGLREWQPSEPTSVPNTPIERLRGLLDYLNLEPTEARETLVAIDECLALYTGSTPILSAETSAMLCCGAEAAEHVREIEREHHKEERP